MRYLQPTELKVLIDVCPGWLRPIVAIAVTTGMRRSEILGLRWLDVDQAHSRILLPQTKNGEGRIVYLSPHALVVVQSLPGGGPLDYVFPDVRPDYVTGAFKRACGHAKIEDFRFHDLRHTAASWMRMAGAIFTLWPSYSATKTCGWHPLPAPQPCLFGRSGEPPGHCFW